MDKINIEKVYKELKNYTNENKAKSFILNLSKELLNFQERLKKIMEVLINKYYNQISPETIDKLKEINELCNLFEKIKINKQLDINIKENPKKLVTDDFLKLLNQKLDSISLEKQEKENKALKSNNLNTIDDSSDFEDALWIPKELLSISHDINRKVENMSFSFIDAIKDKQTNINEGNKNENKDDELAIIEKDNKEIFTFKGEEINDEEFLEILKLKK